MKKLTIKDLTAADRKALVKMWNKISPALKADTMRNDFPKKQNETRENYICRYYTEYCTIKRAN